MFTDTVQIDQSLQEVIKYLWKDEMRNFEETYEVEIESQDDIDTWIAWCQASGNTSHIFFHLMVLRSSYPPGEF